MTSAGDDEPKLGPTARRMILGAQLRKLREETGLTRKQAGRNIRGSDSKISRMELGDVSFKEIDVADLLTLYGVSDPDERQRYFQFAEESNQPGWWRRYGDVMPSWLNELVGLEEAASRIQAYEVMFVHGLLQTEDYARTISSNGRPSATSDEVEKHVAVKMRRQKLLLRKDAPQLWVVMDESVLHRTVGGAKVMRGQLERLLEVADLPNISLQIVPNAVSGFAAESAFSILRFAEDELPNIVYIEHRSDALYIEDVKKAEPHIRAFDRLMVDAQTPERSKQTLDKLRNDLV